MWVSPQTGFFAGEGFPFLGRTYRLVLVYEQGAAAKLRWGRFRLLRRDVPQGREVLTDWYIDHAKPWIEQRVAGWAGGMGVGPRWCGCGISATGGDPAGPPG